MEITNIIESIVAKYFRINIVHLDEKAFYFIVHDYSRGKFLSLVENLDKIGYLPFIEGYGGKYKLNIANKPKHGKSKVHYNIFLFLVTIVTTVSAGYLMGGTILEGVAFSAAIMAIIGTHETAHFFAARKHDVKATLPYFIPSPLAIGTFGAVINVKSAIPNKNALFDLGVSGPIAGFLVTIPVLIIGIYFSQIVPLQSGAFSFYPPLLMQIITYFTSPVIPAGYDLYVSPVAFAGWVGAVITMLNLMPVAFLDGGHISRALFNEKTHKYVSIAGMIVTLALGWIFMTALMAFIFFRSKRHPGALDNVSDLSKNRKILSIVIILIFILCLSPYPIYLLFQ